MEDEPKEIQNLRGDMSKYSVFLLGKPLNLVAILPAIA